MSAYPSQVNSAPQATPQPNSTKQAAIIITLTLLLLILWVIVNQFGLVLLNTVIPLKLLTETPAHYPTNLIPNAIYQVPTWQLAILILIIFSFFLSFLTATALLITHRFLRLIPLLLPPLILIPFTSHLPQQIVTVLIAIIFPFLFTTSVVSDLDLYKTFSLNRLIHPHISHLFIALSAILTLPTFFYLYTHPDSLPQFIDSQFITPITQNLIDQTLPSLPSESDLLQNQDLPQPRLPDLQQYLPPQFSDLIDFQLKKLAPSPQATPSSSSDTSDQSPSPDSLPSDLLQPIQQSITNNILNQDQLHSSILDQVTQQVNQFISPLYPYLPFLIALVIFFTIYQLASFLKFLIFVPLWLLFKLILALKIAQLVNKNEPVQVLQI